MAPTDLPVKGPGSDRRNPQLRHHGQSDLERAIDSRIRHLLNATDALSAMLMASKQNAPPVTQQNQASESTSQAAHPKPKADNASSLSISSNYRKLTDSSPLAVQPKPQDEGASSLSFSSKHQILYAWNFEVASKLPSIRPKQQFEDALVSSAVSKHRRFSDSKLPTAYPKLQALNVSSSSVGSNHRFSILKSSEAESKSQAESQAESQTESQAEFASSSSVSFKQRHSESPAAQLQPQAEEASLSTISSRHWKISSSTKPSQKHKQPRRVHKPHPALSSYQPFDSVRTLISSKGIQLIKKRQEQQEKQLQKEQELIDIALNQSTDIARANYPCRMLLGQLLVSHLQLKSTILRVEVLKTESRLQQAELSPRTALKSAPASTSDKKGLTELESDLFKLTRSPVSPKKLQPEDVGVYEKESPFLACLKVKAMEHRIHRVPCPDQWSINNVIISEERKSEPNSSQ